MAGGILNGDENDENAFNEIQALQITKLP